MGFLIFKQSKVNVVWIRIVLFLIVFNSFSIDAMAFDADSVFRYTKFNVGYNRGFVYPYQDVIQFHNNEYVNGFDFRIGRTFPSINRSRIPTIGLGGYFSNLGSSNLYGNLYSPYLYFESSFITRKYFVFGSNVSSGLGWVTKPNHPILNPMNQAIGSHLNVFIVFALDFQFRVSNSLTLSFSPSFIHISNGKIKLPNAGLNMYTLRFGVGYNIKDEAATAFVNQHTTNYLKPHRLSILLSGGVKEDKKQGPILKGLGGLNTNYSYLLSKNGRAGGGVDLFYIPTTYKYQTEQQVDENPSSWSGGVYLGYEIVWDKLSFVLQQGIRLFNENPYESDFYSRLGVRFRFARKYVANCSLKTNRLTAEYIEWGIGYDFNF